VRGFGLVALVFVDVGERGGRGFAYPGLRFAAVVDVGGRARRRAAAARVLLGDFGERV
jgi:hypothetical protein